MERVRTDLTVQLLSSPECSLQLVEAFSLCLYYMADQLLIRTAVLLH